jgi:hypothetical protein
LVLNKIQLVWCFIPFCKFRKSNHK